MNKRKIITGVVTTGVLSGLVVPLVTSCSCNKEDNNLNLKIVENEHITTTAKQAKLNESLILEYKLDDECVLANIEITIGGKVVPVDHYKHDEVHHTVMVYATYVDKKDVVVNISANFVLALQSIEITSKPTKLIYYKNETLDLTGMVVTGHYNDKQDREITEYTTSPSTSTPLAKKGINKVVVSYEGKTADFEILVDEQIESIEIGTMPTKTTYKIGDKLDLSGLVVYAKLSGGTKQQVLTYTTDPASGYVFDELGEKTITVTYKLEDKTFTTEFKVNVVDYIKDFEVSWPETLLTYKDRIDISQLGVKAIYAVGEPKSVDDFTAKTPSGVTIESGTTEVERENNGFIVGPNLCKVEGEFENVKFNKTFNINVQDEIESITVNSTSMKTEYKYSETVDLNGLVVTANYKSGDSVVLNSNQYKIYDPVSKKEVRDGSTILDNTVIKLTPGDEAGEENEFTVKCDLGSTTLTDTFKLKVKDYVASIEQDATSSPQKTYTYKDQFTTSNLKVNKVYKTKKAVGIEYSTNYKIFLGSDEVKNNDVITSDKFAQGNNQLTIKFNDDTQITTNLSITVNDAVESFVVNYSGTEPFTFGNVVDFSKLSVKAVWKSTRETNVTSYTVKSPNDTTLIHGGTKITTKNGFDGSHVLTSTSNELTIDAKIDGVTYKHDDYPELKFSIDVKDAYDRLSATYSPANDIYFNDVFNIDDLSVKLFYKSDDETAAGEDAEAANLTYYSPNNNQLTPGEEESKLTTALGFAEGQNTITIKGINGYAGINTTYNMTVNDKIEKITASTTKTEYVYGSMLEMDKISVKEVWLSGKTDTPVASFEVWNSDQSHQFAPNEVLLPNDTTKLADGENTLKIKVTYAPGDIKYADLVIKLTDQVSELEVTYNQPSDFVFGQAINKNGLTVKAKYKSQRTSSEKDVTSAAQIWSVNANLTAGGAVLSKANGINGAGSTTATANTLYVKYTENNVTVSKPITVNVKDQINSLNVTSPIVTSYKITDKLNLAGFKVSEVYASGNTNEITSGYSFYMNNGTTAFSATEALSKADDVYANWTGGYNTVKIGHDTATSATKGTFNITIYDTASALQIKTAAKTTQFWVGETFNTTNLEIQAKSTFDGSSWTTISEGTADHAYTIVDKPTTAFTASAKDKEIKIVYNGDTTKYVTYKIQVWKLIDIAVSDDKKQLYDESGTLNDESVTVTYHNGTANTTDTYQFDPDATKSGFVFKNADDVEYKFGNSLISRFDNGISKLYYSLTKGSITITKNYDIIMQAPDKTYSLSKTTGQEGVYYYKHPEAETEDVIPQETYALIQISLDESNVVKTIKWSWEDVYSQYVHIDPPMLESGMTFAWYVSKDGKTLKYSPEAITENIDKDNKCCTWTLPSEVNTFKSGTIYFTFKTEHTIVGQTKWIGLQS